MKYAVLTRKNIVMGLCILIWLIVLISVIVSTLSVKAAQTEKRLPVYCVETEDMAVSLTFNCGWTDEGSDEILKILRENHIKATFFFVGSFAEKYPEAVRKIYNEGHETGNHSMYHKDPKKQNYSEILSDTSKCNEKLYSLTGKKPLLYRAPSGAYTDEAIEAAESLGMTAVQWNVDSLDWKNLSPEKITERIISKTVPGSVILLHVGKENTVKALPGIIAGLKEKGFEIRKTGDLLLTDNFYIDFSGRQRKKPQS